MKKLFAVDLLRSVSVLAVILIHVSAGYIEQLSPALIMNQWARFSVPLFLLLSGFLLNRQKPLSPGAFYRKRFSKLLLPYVLWTIFYVWFLGRLNGTPFHWQDTLPALVYGTGCYHLYFMVIILQLYLLFPWLTRQLNQRPRMIVAATVLLTSASQLTLYLAMLSLIQLPAPSHPLYLVIFPVWIGFFSLGMLAANQYDRLQAYSRDRTFKIGLLWLAAFLLFCAEGRFFGSYPSSIRLMTFPYTLASAWFLFSLGLTSPPAPRWSQLCAWLSRQGFLIYLLHPAILYILQLKLGPISAFFLEGRLIAFITLLTSTITLSLLFAAIAPHIPGSSSIGATKD